MGMEHNEYLAVNDGVKLRNFTARDIVRDEFAKDDKKKKTKKTKKPKTAETTEQTGETKKEGADAPKETTEGDAPKETTEEKKEAETQEGEGDNANTGGDVKPQ